MTITAQSEKERIHSVALKFLENLNNKPYFVAEDSWEFRYDIFFDRENDRVIHLFQPDLLSKETAFLSILNSNDIQLKDKLFVHLDIAEKGHLALDKEVREDIAENNQTFGFLDSTDSLKLTSLFNYSFDDAKRAYEYYFTQLLLAIKESNPENFMYYDSVELIRNKYFSQEDMLTNSDYVNFLNSSNKFQKDVLLSYLFLANATILINNLNYSKEELFDVFIKYINNDYTYQNMRLIDIYRVPFSYSTVEYISLRMEKSYIKEYEYPSSFSNKDEFIDSFLDVWDSANEQFSIIKNLNNF